MPIKTAQLSRNAGAPVVRLECSANAGLRYSISLWSRAKKAYIEKIAFNEATGDGIPDYFLLATPIDELDDCIVVCVAFAQNKTTANTLWVDLIMSQNDKDVAEKERLTATPVAQGQVIKMEIKLVLDVVL